MPQASDELREEVAKIIPPLEGEGIHTDCGEADAWLKARGWIEKNTGWMFSPKPIDECTHEEFLVMLYLRDEWDYAYGGVIVGAR